MRNTPALNLWSWFHRNCLQRIVPGHLSFTIYIYLLPHQLFHFSPYFNSTQKCTTVVNFNCKSHKRELLQLHLFELNQPTFICNKIGRIKHRSTMPVETMMTSDATNWPAVGNPPPPVSDDPNPEWEMIAEDEEVNTANHVVISGNLALKGRPRSHTIGGEAATAEANTNSATGLPKTFHRFSTAASDKASTTSSFSGSRRTFRRCASTPDLLISDNAHERIVEDESDSEDYEDSDNNVDERAGGGDQGSELSESFEVVSDENQEDGAEEDACDIGDDDDDDDEPVMIDEESNTEESGTLVSTPSVGTSSWTMAGSSAAPVATTSVWGMKKSPSFADMVAKNLDSNGSCEFEQTKAVTEAKLRDSHRRHHLRVRTKPKFVVADDTNKSAGGGGMMKHAHSTGDLTKMLHAVEEGHESSLSTRRNRRVKKQLSAMMEEEDESADFIIGRGNGTSSSGGGGGDVCGDTDAMDYYHRKDLGSKSTSNKKKLRPDEAKRKDIIMYKKEMQRKQQQAAQAGKDNNEDSTSGGKKKKKKNEKGFGGKKERRRG